MKTATVTTAVLLAICLGVLMVTCGGEKEDVIGSPAPEVATPKEVAEAESRLDCGSGEGLVAQDDLLRVALFRDDVDEPVFRSESSAFDGLGDEYFERTADRADYLNGVGTLHSSGEVLEGRIGHLVTSIVSVFVDEDSAKLLFEHPYIGEPSVERIVQGRRFGDQSETSYVEVSMNGDTLLGYIVQFRAGPTVVYVGNLAVDEEVSLRDTEELAELVCVRMRQQ